MWLDNCMRIPNHIETFWKEFLDSEVSPESANDYFLESFQIGSNRDEADEGAKLILSGEKTATSSLLWERESSGELLPWVGALSVVEDGEHRPVCVIRTTWIEVIPFGEIDASFACDYSETDGTLESWYEVFGDYYSDVCESMGRRLSEETPLVCERFQVIFR